MVARQIRWWRTKRRFRPLMADSLRCRAKSGTKGLPSAVLRAPRLTTLGETDFRCVSDFGLGTAAHNLRTGTTFEALLRAHKGGPAPATWPTRPHREFETYSFTAGEAFSFKNSTPHFRPDFARVFTFSRFAPRRALRCLRSHAPRSVARRAASSPAMLTPPAGGAQPPQARALPLTFYPCGRRATRTAPCDAKHGRESPRSSAP